jgi:ribosomal protein L14
MCVHENDPLPFIWLTHVCLVLPWLPGRACAGSAITGPVAKECADLWPRIASAANSIV